MNHTFSVAPMLDWTDKHCRYLHRLISHDVVLYSEMITTPAILNGDKDKYIGFNQQEKPVILQLGGSHAEDLASSCEFAENFGYDGINLNVGCPSDRVQKGRFGACLMNEPPLVVECVKAMMNAVDIPISIKCRIGVDNNDSFENLHAFIETVANAGVQTIAIHARKALLKGLSPKQNRSVPPLNYDFVYRIKQLFPELTIIINGGINSTEEVQEHLNQVDGVMLGRAIWNNPWLLHDLQNNLITKTNTINDETIIEKSRDSVLKEYIRYCESEVNKGVKLHWLLPPVLNLFHGLPGNKKWKSHLVTETPKRGKDLSVFEEARGYIFE